MEKMTMKKDMTSYRAACRNLTALGFVILLGGCQLTPDYAEPQVALPEAWRVETAQAAAQQEKIDVQWWKAFKSAELNNVMATALDGNTDLRGALARIDQARAAAKIAGAPLLPSVDASAGTGWNRTNPSSGKTTSQNSGRAGVSVGYEVDLFGRNRAGLSAAEANLRGTVYDRDALELVVKGDVAQGYFSILNLRERMDIARSNLENSRQVLRIVEARYNAGTASALDVSRQKTSLASAEASLTALGNQERAAENALSILLGQAPGNMGLKAKSLQSVTVPRIPVSQPSAVVAQRPDIRAAEEALVAANADIGAARAAFFPVLNLGVDTTVALSPLSDPASVALALAASAAAPIFKGGQLQGGVDRARARQAELVETYRKAVIVSMREVEDSLSSAQAARQREVSLKTAMDEARKAYGLSRDLYEAGAVDFQTMLDAERTKLSAEDSHASVRLELLSAAVDLYKALGGGWSTTAPKR
jgi:NodT family efflux transporter outer membrane factor (OMF) lipoprotein